MNATSIDRNDPRSFAKSLRNGMIVLVIFSGFLVGTGIYFNTSTSKYATILYHYNAEYRAGSTAIENAIINVAIPELIKMYYTHPQWNWTLELQAWAILNMSQTNATVFGMLEEMINNGQCELISPLWSYQLLTAFSTDDVKVSLTIARNMLRGLNITRFTRVLFFQESQTFPGFGNQVFKDFGFDTVMIGTHILSLHGINPTKPLYRQRMWNDPSKDFYYLPYNWVPELVQDGFHFWTFLATGETVTGRNVLTAQGSGQNESAYLPAPELIQAHAEHLQKLYESGYKLMTINDYVTILEGRNEITNLENYVPETTWRDLPGFEINRDDSNGLWTWMAYNTAAGNATHPGNDDGDQLAETYRTGNYIKAVRTLLLANWSSLAPVTRDALNATIFDAYKYYFKAQGTDAYGWEPGWIIDNVLHESDYSRNNNRLARELAATVLQNLSTTLNLGSKIQVFTENMSLNAGTAAYANETADWINETVTPTSETLANLPISILVNNTQSGPAYSVAISNCTYDGFTYKKVDITMPSMTRVRVQLGTTYPFWYSPTFYEDRAYQYTLEGDEPFFLPISNGLVFFGDNSSGIAVIKNCSSRHVALMADKNWIGYREESDSRHPYAVKNVHYSFLVAQGTLQNAIDLAYLANIRPVLTLDTT